MDDLISRQAAIEAFDGVKVDEENCIEYGIGYNDGIDFAVSRLSVLPAAQPEIIRCKDCKYAHLTRDGKCKYCDTLTDDDGYPLDLYVDGDFYCGNAERRTDG